MSVSASSDRLQSPQPRQILMAASQRFARVTDVDGLCRELVDLVLPELGDFCVVEILAPGKQSQLGMFDRSVVHSSLNAYVLGHAEELQSGPLPPVLRSSRAGLAAALERGAASFRDPILSVAEDAPLAGVDPAWMEKRNVHGWLSVPLMASVKVYGAISLLSMNPSRRYSSFVMTLAQCLGCMAAMHVRRLTQDPDAASAPSHRRSAPLPAGLEQLAL
jgi:hypothetical protein